MAQRPVSVTVTAVLLLLLAVVTVMGGLALSWVSACCGSRDPADPAPFLWSLPAAGLLAVAGSGLLTGGLSRWLVLALVATVVGGCLLAARHSSDLQVVFVVLLLGWIGMVVLLGRPGPSAWLGH